MADHLLGALADHHHDGDADHDHDHDAMDGLRQPGDDGAVVLTSIGIDVGSSGTQVAFSRLHLDGAGPHAHRRLHTRRRETIYQSPVALTPYAPRDPSEARSGGGSDGSRAADMIDEAAIGRVLDQAFAAAGLTPDEIDCGVVILTGAARERGNAEVITRRLATACGDIVSASAGHHMEARLAAHGSGAVERSAATGKRFLNVDIGGGTTKLAVCAAGEIEATAALAIGGRQVATDPRGTILRLEPAGAAWAAARGIDWHLGGRAEPGDMAAVAAAMADALIAVLTTGSNTPDVERHLGSIYVTAPPPDVGAIDGVVVSGGVAEYVYGRETRDCCDLGRLLGRALATRIDAGALPWPLMPAAECIRATVLGASGYTVQLSGQTGCITAPASLLPARNLPVLHPLAALDEKIDASKVGHAIRAHLADFDIDAANEAADFVLAFRWNGPPEHERLRAFAEGIAKGLSAHIQAALPVRIILDGDVALSLGHILRGELGVASALMILDGIALADFDFVDLGRLRLPSQTVPVTIKTLIFRDMAARHSRSRSPSRGHPHRRSTP